MNNFEVFIFSRRSSIFMNELQPSIDRRFVIDEDAFRRKLVKCFVRKALS